MPAPDQEREDRTLLGTLLEADSAIRYVALGRGQTVTTAQRAGLTDASSGESDRYEELLVNPTVVLLLRQRGEIDPGAAQSLGEQRGSFLVGERRFAIGYRCSCSGFKRVQISQVRKGCATCRNADKGSQGKTLQGACRARCAAHAGREPA